MAETITSPSGVAGLGNNALAQDPELVSEFIVESLEHLRSIESHMLAIEGGTASTEAIHAMFRGFHTIKGLAGFLELPTIQRVSHEVETLLDRARNGELALTPAVVDVVLESADLLRKWLAAIQTGAEGPDASELIVRVQQVLGGGPATPACVPGPAAEPDEAEPASVEPAPGMLADTETPLATGQNEAVEATEQPPAGPDPAPCSPEAGLAALSSNARPAAEAKSVEAQSVKVDTSKLDHLVDMVGEMVIAQSMLRHDPELEGASRPRLMRNLAQLTRITDEVQKTAMAMRMVPIEHLFQRMRRVVRDLARKTGKEIEMEITGGETELDRHLVEELADPLMHMLRNAVDHGIEPVEKRLERGKPAAGHVRLRAAHKSGHIVIEVGDDGSGLDRARILAKARQNGLIGADEEPADERTYGLIFEPGFSTAAAVTSVSGRGVGMDVVRRHVQKLRGRIEIQSEPGRGSTFLLKLPLTLAIVDGLVVGVGKERYIIPLFAVREMFRPEKGAVLTVQDKGEIATVRGHLLPVVRLYRRFGIAPRSEDPSETLLIVAEAANRVFCLMVDSLIGKQEVVIKNLGPVFQNVPGIAGGAILGDGRVGLILDLDRVFDPQEGS